MVEDFGIEFPEEFDFPLQLLCQGGLDPCRHDGGQLSFYHLELLLQGLLLLLEMTHLQLLWLAQCLGRDFPPHTCRCGSRAMLLG